MAKIRWLALAHRKSGRIQWFPTRPPVMRLGYLVGLNCLEVGICLVLGVFRWQADLMYLVYGGQKIRNVA
tara:strand:- start:64 stop:273 length:210 start_codon:yes stop_codon:yes gene_type:complete